MEPLLRARTALVTGGGAGIGAAVCRAFAREGARVLFVECDAARAQDTLATLEAEGCDARTVVGDVREADTVRAAVSAARELGDGAVDILVNNAGDYRPAGLFAASREADWNALYAINLQHAFRFAHALLPSMMKRGRGAIVNIATIEALRGIPACSVYAAFKAGLVQWTRSLAVEVGNHGVRVNAVAPDVIDTPQTPYREWLDAEQLQQAPAWIPVGRFGAPEDVADAVLFLASDLARFVTGTTLPTDGGTLAASGWYKRLPKESWTNRPKKP